MTYKGKKLDLILLWQEYFMYTPPKIRSNIFKILKERHVSQGFLYLASDFKQRHILSSTCKHLCPQALPKECTRDWASHNQNDQSSQAAQGLRVSTEYRAPCRTKIKLQEGTLCDGCLSWWRAHSIPKTQGGYAKNERSLTLFSHLIGSGSSITVFIETCIDVG